MRICADSCFLIALYDETDDLHSPALKCFDSYIEQGRHHLLVPWPVMYESISTRMARVPRRMDLISRHLKILRTSGKLDVLDDTEYREAALRNCFPDIPPKIRRSLSLVDIVIREILSTKRIQTHALATFNHSDFYDVCKRHRKRMLPE
jgi:predicted nucleic acid-binding protein